METFKTPKRRITLVGVYSHIADAYEDWCRTRGTNMSAHTNALWKEVLRQSEPAGFFIGKEHNAYMVVKEYMKADGVQSVHPAFLEHLLSHAVHSKNLKKVLANKRCKV